MTGPPPVLTNDQQTSRDAEHLKLLSTFHFIFAALGLFGIAFLALHCVLMSAIFTNPEMWKNTKSGPPPEIFLKLMLGGYAFGLIVILTGGVLNLLSGLSFGTLLGVFTILILSRDSVRKLYEVSGGSSSGTG